jgi:hypothetical protein
MVATGDWDRRLVTLTPVEDDDYRMIPDIALERRRRQFDEVDQDADYRQVVFLGAECCRPDSGAGMHPAHATRAS